MPQVSQRDLGGKRKTLGRYFSYAKPGRQGCRHGPRPHHQTHVMLPGGLVVQGALVCRLGQPVYAHLPRTIGKQK